MSATILLLVKGDEATARDAATRRGFDVTGNPARDDKRGSTFLRASGPEGIILARAVWWLTELRDVPEGGYPPGTLLWHSGTESAS